MIMSAESLRKDVYRKKVPDYKSLALSHEEKAIFIVG